MKTVKSKPVKKGPLCVPMKDTSKGKKMPKGKARILGTGTFQLKKHSPRVV
jgi:hypothetical protein